MSIDLFCQIVITICGCSSIYLLASQDAQTRMVAGIIGLIGEPFWFATAYMNEQYGILILVFVYGVSWARLVWSNYLEVYPKNLFGKEWI